MAEIKTTRTNTSPATFKYASGKEGESRLTGFSPRKQEPETLRALVEHSVAEMRKRPPAV